MTRTEVRADDSEVARDNPSHIAGTAQNQAARLGAFLLHIQSKNGRVPPRSRNNLLAAKTANERELKCLK